MTGATIQNVYCTIWVDSHILGTFVVTHVGRGLNEAFNSYYTVVHLNMD
jgi:hypothetical protein